MTTPAPHGTRITVVTAGHLSAAPRMLKAADALACAGYRVRVVSINSTPWATATDAVVKATRRWPWSVVDYDAVTGRALRRKTGARFRLTQSVARLVGPSRVPLAVAIRAYGRAHDELVRAVTAEPADFIYGGSTGALAAVVESARRLGVRYGIDFEDLHSAEHDGPGSALTNTLAARVERHVIARASFVTAASPMIAEAYAGLYGVRVLPIHNTFSLVPAGPLERANGPLRVYWFSQTLGAGRGLEEVIRACGAADVPVALHLRARAVPDYAAALRTLGAAVAPKLDITLHEPAAPDEMVALAQPYDAGLACEEPSSLSRRLCLSNKLFTYLAAGVPVILSRTPAQARLEPDLGDAAFGYDCGDVAGLARVLTRLATEPQTRARARLAARAAAERRWHWEHPDDRGALVAAVEAVL